MKTRTSFVSNSSSGSFVVAHRPWKTKDQPVLSRKQVTVLEEFGFVASGHLPCPIHIEYSDWHDRWKKFEPIKGKPCSLWKKARSFLRYVDCNEDEVVSFLLKNEIPFEGLLHYAHFSVIYDGKSKYVTILTNYGLIYSSLELPEQVVLRYPAIEKRPVSYWLEGPGGYEVPYLDLEEEEEEEED